MESNAKPQVNVSYTSSNYVRPLRPAEAPNRYGNTRRKYRVDSWMRNNATNPFFRINKPPILPPANPPNSSAVKGPRPSNLRRNAVLAARAKKVKVAGGSRKKRRTTYRR